MRGLPFLSVLVAVALVPVLSGCLSPSTPTTIGPARNQEPLPTSGKLLDETKEPLPEGANPDLGALRGNIVSRNGGGVIKSARILLLGLDRQTQANEYGAFAFNDVTPGEVTLRAEATQYLAAEVQLVVEKGFLKRLNVTLEPEDPLHMEHVHDYWFVDGTPVTRRLLLDDVVEFPWSAASGGDQEAICGSAPPTTLQPAAVQSANGVPNLAATSEECRMIPVPLSGQGPQDGIIWPGTKELDVTISWKNLDHDILPKVQLKYRPANFTQTGTSTGTTASVGASNWPPRIEFQRGETHKIDVSPQMTDVGHARWTKWAFWIIIDPQVADNSLPVQGDVIRRVVEDFDVKIEAVKGALPVEAAHPAYWAQGDRLRLLDNATLVVGGELTSLAASHYPIYKRNASSPSASISWMLPGEKAVNGATVEGKIVPPGTTHLRVVLFYEDSWSVPEDANTFKSLGIRTASVNPSRATLADLKNPTHTTTPRGATTWYFKLDDPKVNDETDVFYSRASSWMFLLANEGQEKGDEFKDEASAAGYTAFRLTVEAINENWKQEFDAGLI